MSAEDRAALAAYPVGSAVQRAGHPEWAGTVQGAEQGFCLVRFGGGVALVPPAELEPYRPARCARCGGPIREESISWLNDGAPRWVHAVIPGTPASRRTRHIPKPLTESEA